ncbi:2-oxoacid:acceptor oxidoreductase subunit alpha [Candidatus Peregrinibacteria bacterium]|nr:2-oxoacid:acceptor oxidoreductase subunit alpha [Candidatus Peregrinibacteria bacterium]
MKRNSIKLVGQSGSGLLSTGEILANALKNIGFYINTDREFPSLIKGGHSSFQVDFSTEPIRSSTSYADILIGMDEHGLKNYVDKTRKGGIVIHGFERHEKVMKLKKSVEERELKVAYLPAREIAESFGGNVLMTNMILLGLLWKILDFPLEPLEEEVKKRFASKPALLEIDLKCLHKAYESEDTPDLKIEVNKEKPETILINGNYAIGIGGIQAGVRTFYAYPMSPASSILSYLAATYHESGMLVKQAEDEITAVQMTMGAMYAGSRAFTATSGGGFDLMTESVSAAGIMECPLVVVIAQRPGPGTGLPTWTCQGDLNLAIHAGHGEYGKAVLACSDPYSAYEQIQHALNIAEKYQVPVILLSEKEIAESMQTVPRFKEDQIPIERGLTQGKDLEELKSTDRYAITDSGVSKRWIPGSTKTYFYSNSDEHWEDGVLTEEADKAGQMYEKRLKKMETMLSEFPDPIVYGEEDADISFVGWGSSKNVMLDVIEYLKSEGVKVNYLHYDYLWPLKTEKFVEFFDKNKRVCLIEGNHGGQLGQLLEDKTNKLFASKLLKFDGRAFFFDEVLEFIKANHDK